MASCAPMSGKGKVLVGMSGGVDSSVSAALLLEEGYEVVGAFMKNWSDCQWRTDKRDAARVAAKLGIAFETLDFEEAYRREVVDEMFREFAAGRTPNPDVMCNRCIKFDRFVREADRLGCNFVATGHYARARPAQDGRVTLCAGRDKNKDQSYFLWAIRPEVLPRILFPIGEMEKPRVRAKARELGLSVANKKDSMGICFVGEVEMRTFLQERIPKQPGRVVTVDGKVVGSHEGLAFYTIGQRHGLQIGGGDPYYVVSKRSATGELVVASNFHPALFDRSLTAVSLNWFSRLSFPIACQARIRYRQPLQPCRVSSQAQEGAVSVIFSTPQRAITPAQSIVFYDGDEVLGGGVIL